MVKVVSKWQNMLRYYGINDVSVVIGQGFLSDHYNPSTKTVALSPDVFGGRSIAAAAVAAHNVVMLYNMPKHTACYSSGPN